jgi:hypothetical protein
MYAPTERDDTLCTVTVGLCETEEDPPGTGSATDTDFLAIFLDQKCGEINISKTQGGLLNTRAHLQIPKQKGTGISIFANFCTG